MVGHSCSPRCRRSHFTESDWEVHKHLTAKLIELLSSDDAVRNWSFETGNQAYISRKKGPFLSQVTKKLFADDPIFGGQYHTRYIQLLELTRSRIYHLRDFYIKSHRFRALNRVEADDAPASSDEESPWCNLKELQSLWNPSFERAIEDPVVRQRLLNHRRTCPPASAWSAPYHTQRERSVAASHRSLSIARSSPSPPIGSVDVSSYRPSPSPSISRSSLTPSLAEPDPVPQQPLDNPSELSTATVVPTVVPVLSGPAARPASVPHAPVPHAPVPHAPVPPAPVPAPTVSDSTGTSNKLSTEFGPLLPPACFETQAGREKATVLFLQMRAREELRSILHCAQRLGRNPEERLALTKQLLGLL
ncbi:hypothetical protein SISNIDRAFT_492036 [Sistotremastrum niveocremeum HHB9708]|uniref:Uncharacterized protein n=1 Tax=Sistotremastrum niveocremeum HHB9708 TaxID=1314777 RepID=A0A164M4F7_9AGAM|nr:hypothetical protein SISNIDRAFT_492036 [Sistotremastrum niveocremeum HHB9708]